MCTCINVNMYICVYIARLCADRCVALYVWKVECVNIHMYINMYMYTSIDVFIHSFVYVGSERCVRRKLNMDICKYIWVYMYS